MIVIIRKNDVPSENQISPKVVEDIFDTHKTRANVKNTENPIIKITIKMQMIF
jgi:hypothetical protein